MRISISYLFLVQLGCSRVSHDAPDATLDSHVVVDGGDLFCSEFAGQADVPFVGHFSSTDASQDSFVAQACSSNDAIAIHVGCQAQSPMTSVTITAPGWDIQQIGSLGGTSNQIWASSFVAISPQAQVPTTFTVTWAPSSCTSVWEVGDELTQIDLTAGASPFDGHAEVSGIGDCQTRLLKGSADDVLWGACSSSGHLMNFGQNYSPGTSDGFWHWTEYQLSTDPPGTLESVGFQNTPGESFVMTAIAVKHK